MKTIAVGILGMAAGGSAMAQPPADDWFDESRVIEIKGEVVSADWVSPRVVIRMTDEAGKAWLVEGGTPNTMLRWGVNKGSLQPGQKLKVCARPPRDAVCAQECPAKAMDIIFPGGIGLPYGGHGDGVRGCKTN